MTVLQTCFLAALVVAVVAQLLGPAAAVSCTGGNGGGRWCTRGEKGSPAAHKTDSCPKVCRKKACEDVKPAKGERRGIFLEHEEDDDDDDNMGRGMNWEDIARTGLYEHIYAVDDKYVCLTSCWYQPWKAKCDRWEEAFGRKYCLDVNCEHDTYGEKGGNRTSGCHTDTDGNLKLDWHKPTCNECIQLFPACYDELKSFADREDHSAAELLEASVEAEAKQQCYDKYFQAPGSLAGPGRRLMSDDDDDDSSSGDDDDSDSSEEGSTGPRKGRIGPSWPSKVNTYAKGTVETMLADGTLSCPPAQCLTDDVQLFAARSGTLKRKIASRSAPTPPLTGPWYHSVTEGYCSLTCDGSPSTSLWCNKNVENCMTCKSTWCPPSEALPWDPVTPATYEPKPEWYESTAEGFCSFNTDCKYPSEDPWCRRSLDNCMVCSGAWCPPKAMSGTWEPVSKPKPERHEATTEGFCAFNTNCNEEYPVEDPWCHRSVDNCLVCAGAWCPPSDISVTWEPVSNPKPAQATMTSVTATTAVPSTSEMAKMPTPATGAPNPAEVAEMSMAAEAAAMAPADLFVGGSEVKAQAPGPTAIMTRKMLDLGKDEGFLPDLRIFLDKSQCPETILENDVEVQDFLGFRKIKK